MSQNITKAERLAAIQSDASSIVQLIREAEGRIANLPGRAKSLGLNTLQYENRRDAALNHVDALRDQFAQLSRQLYAIDFEDQDLLIRDPE